MKGVRFYLEHNSAKDKREGNHAGNVVAIFYESYWIGTDIMFDSLSGTYVYPNSYVSSGSTAQGYLDEKCKRISEKKAREIHPRLFERLDK